MDYEITLLDGTVAIFKESTEVPGSYVSERTRELSNALQGLSEFAPAIPPASDNDGNAVIQAAWMMNVFTNYTNALLTLGASGYVKLLSIEMTRLQSQPGLMEKILESHKYVMQNEFLVIPAKELRHIGKTYYGNKAISETERILEIVKKDFPPINEGRRVRILPTPSNPNSRVGVFVHADAPTSKAYAMCRVGILTEGGIVTYEDYPRSQIQPLKTSSKTVQDIGQSVWHSVEKAITC
ncbi:hypothetical protein [Vibrio phage vB_VmeM-Yong XC32]|nr:hypothetical protein [Vibrio phage vB_VmeM-Yong XC31]QAX96412.1 hypothetical protein [Vibrio phage vB_VmeM-Yong XC32]QAX96729.1 hypothetical protein [Vibrio phage vB_VmeM-Yong MS31]QAX97048.1 hypothetical protein [Vibrio phage vB_VmeM-Yong MS32]